ncbi:MAG TPA: ABC transporter substrate-binding protein [Tepidiformaceae bacterium]|nr:ABC transporter substrate-binding protein [Tepidiformaceae bacterium]
MSDYWTRQRYLRANRRRFLGGAGVAGIGAAGLALVGCGDDDDDPASPTTSTGGSPAATTVAQPKSGGRLRWPIPGDPPTLYPYENITFAVQRPSSYHYSRLLRGSTGPDIAPSDFTKIEGDLAQSLPEQPDNLTYTFKFKPNIYFHDKAPMNGRLATAQDFLATWDFFKGSAINASRFNQVIDKIEAPDNSTIKITLKEPNAPFLVVGAASDQGLWFIPVETINNDQAKKDPVGTGPFVFKSWDTGVKQSWDRHPKWFDGPAPYLAGLDAAMIIDPQRILAGLQAGELDNADLAPDKIPDLEKINPKGRISVAPNSSIITVMFNFDNAPWGDKRVRQALSMAMDRPGYLKILDPTGTNPWNSFFGPALVPYFLDPEDSKFGPNAKYFKQDLAEVKKLLSAATGSDTLDVNMISNIDRYGATAQQSWELTASDVKKAGFNAQNVYQEYGAYIQSSYFGKLQDPKAVTLGHLFGTVLDPDDIFMSCYWSNSARHNWSGTPIPEMAKLDTMFLKQRTLLDLEERTDYIHDIQREMAESMLVIPVVNWPGVNFIQGWVNDAYYKADYANIMETFSKAHFTEERIAKG